ncbi:HalOD1 output domain-containing protein [Halopelagius fulvigenes]|uniref:HalOD1 output domain-containing protein n=1 Tax=Halopelagius fulvigenes TaxID=1198324 RepID=A0ABD5U291_9EURY
MESNESKRIRVEVGEEGATMAVVRTVAEAEGVHSLELPPLYGAVDTDVLDAIVRSEVGAESWVAFSYCGYRVEANSSGVVTVAPAHG